MRRQAQQQAPLPCTKSDRAAFDNWGTCARLESHLQVQTEGLIRDHNVTIAFLKEELRDVKVCKDLHRSASEAESVSRASVPLHSGAPACQAYAATHSRSAPADQDGHAIQGTLPVQTRLEGMLMPDRRRLSKAGLEYSSAT